MSKAFGSILLWAVFTLVGLAEAASANLAAPDSPPLNVPLATLASGAKSTRSVTVGATLHGVGTSSLPSLVLSESEQQFLADHPVIRIALNEEGYPPLFTPTKTGYDMEGIAADYLKLISQRLPIQFVTQTYPDFDQALQAVKSQRADMVVAAARTSARESYLNFTRSFMHSNFALIVPRGHSLGAAEPLSAYANQTFAVERGYAANDYLRSLFPAIQIKNYASTEDALKAVAKGEAQVYAGLFITAHYTIEKYLISHLELAGEFDLPTSQLNFGIRKDWDKLLNLMDRAIETVSPEESLAITHHWQPYFTLLGTTAQQLQLTPQEKAMISRLPPLRVGYDKDFQPFSFEQAGQARGMALDYLHLIERKLGLPASSLQGDTWSNVLKRANVGELDVLIAVARNDERERFLHFSGPYYQSPTVLITALDATSSISFNDLAGRRLAILHDHFYANEIRRRYPAINLQECATMSECLAWVADKKVTATLGNLDVCAELIKYQFPGRLQVTELIPDAPSILYFASQKNNPELSVLLEKAFHSISQSEHAQIKQAWLSVRYTPGLSWDKFIYIVLPSVALILAILLFTLYWNRRLQHEIARRRQAEAWLVQERDAETKKAQQRANYIRTISHHVKAAIMSMQGNMALLKRHVMIAQPQSEPSRLASSLEASMRTLQRMLTNVLDYARIESGRLVLNLLPENLHEILYELADEYDTICRLKGLTFHLELDDQLISQVLIDAVRFKQMLANFLVNACKYTDVGFVRLHVMRLDPTHPDVMNLKPLVVTQAAGREPEQADQAAESSHVASALDYQYLKITIQDSGHGMSLAQKQALFEPYQFKEAAAYRAEGYPSFAGKEIGSGFGVLISQEIAHLMGATLVFQSEPAVIRQTTQGVMEIALSDLQQAAETEVTAQPGTCVILTMAIAVRGAS